MVSISEVLEEIGLTKTESKIYLQLILIKEATAGKIAAECRLFRKNVYDSLESMVKKGLVNYNIQRGKKYWKAVNPSKIKSIFEEKLTTLNSILPELQKDFEKNSEEKNVEVYKGLGGLKSINDLMLKEADIIYNLGATNQFFAKLKYYAPYAEKKAVEKKIKGKFLFLPGTQGVKKFEKYKGFSYRYLPENLKPATQIILFKDYSVIFIWSEEPLSILIKSREINKGFKEYFDFLWKLSKK